MMPMSPMLWLQETSLPSCQPFPGCVAIRIHPTTTSTGRKPSRNVPGESRRRRPDVQPPSTGASASTSPAAATIPISSQKRIVGLLANLRGQIEQQPGQAGGNAPASGRESCRRVRICASQSPFRDYASRVETGKTPRKVRLSSANRRASKLADQSSERNSSIAAWTSSEKTCSTTPTSRSLWNGTSTCSCETRFTEVRWQAGQRTARPSAPSPGVSRKKDGGVHRPWPLLRIAEEAPRPLPRSDACCRQLGELADTGSTRDVIRLRKTRLRGRVVRSRARRGSRGRHARRRRAGEPHAEDDGMAGAGKRLERPEARTATHELSPCLGQAKVYRDVSASYMSEF